MSKKIILFIALLTFFSFLLRLYRVTEPDHYYFDEVYHVVTAKGFAQNNPAAYDPFAPQPEEGTAYDWLHPPLAKLIQAGSIKILGDKPFAWRLPSVIFGTAIIPATFVLAIILFGPLVAIFASLVIAFENLTFVMSRITMNDVYVTFFVLLSFIFAVLYIKKNKVKDLFLTSIFLGLAISTKWTGMFAVASIFGLIFYHQFKNRRLKAKFLLFLLILPFVYLASYSQFWLQGNDLGKFINLHKQIWWYQNRGDLEHSYGTTAIQCVPKGLEETKTWCPWVLNIRGVYFSYEQYNDKAGYIYALGNPLIFLAGVLAVSFIIGKLIERWDGKLFIILLGYFIFWVPWIFAPRLLFLYHYLPSLPFLAISLGVTLGAIYKSRFKMIAIVILLAFIAVFFYFWPISSGLPIDPGSIDKYMWLETWR